MKLKPFARHLLFTIWILARPGAIWHGLADETQVTAIASAKLFVSNQVWARACPGATCLGLLMRLEQLESGVYTIRFSESGLGQGLPWRDLARISW